MCEWGSGSIVKLPWLWFLKLLRSNPEILWCFIGFFLKRELYVICNSAHLQVRPPVGAVRANARGPPVAGGLSPDAQPRWVQPWGSEQSSRDTGYLLSGGRGHGEVRPAIVSLTQHCNCIVWLPRDNRILLRVVSRTTEDESLFPGRRLAELTVELNSLLNSEDIRFFENNMWVLGVYCKNFFPIFHWP